MSNRKLDIFEVLNAINTKDYSFYSNLTEEEQKSIAPLVLQRWMTGTRDPVQTILLNEFANPMVFSLQQHRELLFKTLCAAAPGHPARYKWLKTASKKVSNPESLSVIQEYFSVGVDEAKGILTRFDCEELLEMGMELGRDSKVLKAIEKEFK